MGRPKKVIVDETIEEILEETTEVVELTTEQAMEIDNRARIDREKETTFFA